MVGKRPFCHQGEDCHNAIKSISHPQLFHLLLQDPSINSLKDLRNCKRISSGQGQRKDKKIILLGEMLFVSQRSQEVWELGRLPQEIVLFQGSGLGGSLGKGVVFGIRLLRVSMGHILMDETPTWWLNGHTVVIGRLLHKFFRISPHISVLWWGMGRISIFRKIYRGVTNLCAHNSLVFIRLFLSKTSPSQLSLVIPIHSLGILTVIAISLIQKLNSFRNSCLSLVQCICLLLWQIQKFVFVLLRLVYYKIFFLGIV